MALHTLGFLWKDLWAAKDPKEGILHPGLPPTPAGRCSLLINFLPPTPGALEAGAPIEKLESVPVGYANYMLTTCKCIRPAGVRSGAPLMDPAGHSEEGTRMR